MQVTDYPAPKTKAPPREETVAVCVVEAAANPNSNPKSRVSGPALLLVRRPPVGLLAGLWEFPSVVVELGAGEPSRQLAMDRHLAGLGVAVQPPGGRRGGGARLPWLCFQRR